MKEKKILDRHTDENGDLYRFGRAGSRYFVESVAPAWTPRAGKSTWKFFPTKKEAEEAFLRLCDGL